MHTALKPWLIPKQLGEQIDNRQLKSWTASTDYQVFCVGEQSDITSVSCSPVLTLPEIFHILSLASNQGTTCYISS